LTPSLADRFVRAFRGLFGISDISFSSSSE
jgi:hypothetical protein